MADGVWKVVYPYVFGHSRQLSLIGFLIRALLLWEKVTTEEKKNDPLTTTDCNTNRLCQNLQEYAWNNSKYGKKCKETSKKNSTQQNTPYFPDLSVYRLKICIPAPVPCGPAPVRIKKKLFFSNFVATILIFAAKCRVNHLSNLKLT